MLEATPTPDRLWAITVTVPAHINSLSLFDAIADAAHEWEPDDRDGWDIDVSAGPVEDLAAEVAALRPAARYLRRTHPGDHPRSDPTPEPTSSKLGYSIERLRAFVQAWDESFDGGTVRDRVAGFDIPTGPELCVGDLERVLDGVQVLAAEVAALRTTMRQALDPATSTNDAWRLLADHVGWHDEPTTGAENRALIEDTPDTPTEPDEDDDDEPPGPAAWTPGEVIAATPRHLLTLETSLVSRLVAESKCGVPGCHREVNHDGGHG